MSASDHVAPLSRCTSRSPPLALALALALVLLLLLLLALMRLVLLMLMCLEAQQASNIIVESSAIRLLVLYALDQLQVSSTVTFHP